MGTPAAREPAKAPTVVGTIETVGQLSDTELVVSGWAREQPHPGAPVLVITAGKPEQGRWWAIWSDRPDVGPGTGFTGIIELSAPLRAGDLLAIRLGGARALRLYEQRSLLATRQSIALLRASGTARATEQPVLAAAATRYDGTDSVSTSPLPIRIGIDDCIALPGASLVSGWLFDPESLVQSVTLAGSRLDHTWITQARADVIAAVTAEPRFAIHAETNPWCGFSAIVPADTTNLHLTLSAAGTELHLPLQPRAGNPIPLLRAFLASIDPQNPSALDIADRQVAPVLAWLKATKPTIHGERPEPIDRNAKFTLVIGCYDDAEALPTLLATLATDPIAPTTPILVAGPARELAAITGQIERAAEPFGLQVTVIPGDNVDDTVDALALGTSAATAQTVILLSAGMVPASPNWLSTMTVSLAPNTLVTAQHFDASAFGPDPAQRERARTKPGITACIAPRSAILKAFEKSKPHLDRETRSRALLVAINLPIVEAAADVLSMAVSNPARILWQRADRQAAELGQGAK